MNNIEDAYKYFEREVTTASWAFFVWKSINNIAFNDRAVYDAINRNSLYWNTVTHSLQSTFFITLGRLFDIDGDAFSFHAYIRFCIEKLDEFGVDALRSRKISVAREAEPDWLDEYMSRVYVPVEKDFQRLRGEVSRRQKRYEEIYRPIRNKVMAHKEIGAIDNVSELFGRTKIDEIQDFIWCMFQVQKVTWDLMYNGRLNDFGSYQFNEEERVREDVNSLLAKLKA